MEPQKQSYAIPVAIVIAGVLVAGAILWGRSSNAPDSTGQNGTPGNPSPVRTEELIKNVPSASVGEHVLGNPSAPVIVVEYSDIDCPYCRRFHPTMERIIAEYGTAGKVAWVYRQFPLEIHPNAYPQSLAAECVAAEYGNDTFWKFIAALMETKYDADGVPTPVISDDMPAADRVSAAALKLKLDSTKILCCMNAQTYKDTLSAIRTEGIKAGLGQNQTGTPYSIIITEKGHSLIDGAQPYQVVKGLIEKALSN